MHRRPADGDETPALYVDPDYPRDGDLDPDMMAIVKRALRTVEWATNATQIGAEHAESAIQQEQRSATLGRGGSQSVGSVSSLRAEE